LGDYDTGFETKIFSNIRIGRVPIPDYCSPRYGLDFGFGQDPFFFVKVYIIEALKVVYIAAEASEHAVPLRELPGKILTVIEDKGDYVRADSAQPIQIEHLNANGFNVEGAKKGPGSVRAGINWLQSYQIVIDPDCENMREEARLYSWQTDKITKKRLNVPVDANNHGWDAVRYACEDHVMTANADEPDDPGFLEVGF
jgi:phage terminase large subunit